MDVRQMELIQDRKNLHFFSTGAKRFFNSRIGSTVYRCQTNHAHYTFVSSERFDWYFPRRYTVRLFDETTGCVDTIGDFQAYATNRAAHRAAQTYANTH